MLPQGEKVRRHGARREMGRHSQGPDFGVGGMDCLDAYKRTFRISGLGGERTLGLGRQADIEALPPKDDACQFRSPMGRFQCLQQYSPST